MSLFKKVYRAESTIDANIEVVWNILTDLENYKNWNPFTPRIQTDFSIKSPVDLTVILVLNRPPTLQREFMTRFEPPSTMAWGFHWPLLLRAERVQSLVRVGNRTEYHTVDTIQGVLSPVVNALHGENITRGFGEVATSLKKYAESL